MRGGIWLLAALSVVISQIGMHCHGHADHHPDEAVAVVAASLVEAAYGTGEQPATCIQRPPPAVFLRANSAMDAWWRIMPALAVPMLAVPEIAWDEHGGPAARRGPSGDSQQTIGPSGIGLLLLIGVLRS